METPVTFTEPTFPRWDLKGHAVHVWQVNLREFADHEDQFRATLSLDEQKRAARFRFKGGSTDFIVARGTLRFLLSEYLGGDPSQIHLCYNAYGKPALSNSLEILPLRFNASHSDGLALFAFARHCRVGVDIERVRADVAVQEIAERFFAPAEVAALRKLSAHLRTVAFFACWTRKEAFVKARGLGLSLPLDQFVVSMAPGQKSALLSAADDLQAARHWTLCDLHPASGYLAALAVEDTDCDLKCWRYGCDTWQSASQGRG
ncbi:MAG: 4-phosphopantetheinyl transferase [Verrucomicrobiota bacterium]|jgi:4'-phosphopantetheinyl transferase